MKQFKAIIIFFILAIISLQILFASDQKPESVTILHTNDIHGSFLPITIKAKMPNDKDRKLGGILALNHYINKIRGENKPILLLDAGDFMTGSPICEMEYEGALGGPMIKFFNFVGYEGLTPGNHEFDISVQNARKLFELCEFPVFSCNLYTSDSALFTTEPYQIYSKGKLVIGVIGAIVNNLPDYLNKPQKKEVVSKTSASIIELLSRMIDPLTDLIIVLSHSGLEADKQLAEKLSHRVDVIIGGHSHHRLEEVVNVNRKLIVQAGSYLRNLGRLDLNVVADTVQSYDYQLIPLWNEEIQPDSILVGEVKKYEQLIEKEYGRVIGELKTPWTRSHHSESNIGNYIADCIRNFSEADFALINSGGIRQNLDVGPIKKLDIKNILPFNNSITKFSASGRQLMDLIRNNAQAAATQSNGILQVSGLHYKYYVLKDGSITISDAKISGNNIEPEKTYLGATVDYVITNAERYLSFNPVEVTDLMMPLTDVVMKMIEQQELIASKVEGRIFRKN